VTAIGIGPEAVDIMLRRGVRTARRADVFEYRGGPFDTLVMLGHGIGIVEDLAGLRRFLTHAKKLVKPTGQLLVDSLDVSRSREPEDLAYQEAKRKADRYRGEMVMQIEFGDTKGPFCGWLHVDPGTLEDHAMETGWTCETIPRWRVSGLFPQERLSSPGSSSDRIRTGANLQTGSGSIMVIGSAGDTLWRQETPSVTVVRVETMSMPSGGERAIRTERRSAGSE